MGKPFQRWSKKVVSVMLSAAMVLSTFGGMELTAKASNVSSSYVKRTVNSGENMNLTEEGSLDWIHFAGGGIRSRKANVEEVIHYEALSGVKVINEAGDSAMSYSYNDGTLVESANAVTTAAVYGCNGDAQGIIEEGVGFTLSVEAAEEERVLSFVSGIWEATAEVLIQANDVALYEDTLAISGGAQVTRYSITIAENESLLIQVRQTARTNDNGNVTLGGVAIKESQNTMEYPMLVDREDIAAGKDVNLTEEGTLDWLYFDGENDDQKANGEGLQVSFLENSNHGTFSDSKVAYSWSDGTSRQQVDDTTKGKVLIGRSYPLGNLPTNAQVGYRIQVAESEQDQMLTFAPGVWEGTASVSVTNGQSEIYYDSFSAGGGAVQKKYTIAIEAGQAVDVTVKLISHSNGDGNVTVGGIALKEQTMTDNVKELIGKFLKRMETLDFSNYEAEEVGKVKQEIVEAKAILENDEVATEDAITAYEELKAAYEDCLNAEVDGRYKYESNSGLTSSFGWEGDLHAPIAYIDGSYRLRDRNDVTIGFGVRDIPGKIKWYNAEDYLPCFISEFSKDGMDYKIENFANRHEIGGNAYEIAYSRMTVTNNTDEEQLLPVVSSLLISLNEAAENGVSVQPGETVVRDYAIGADRFDGDYEYPASEEIAQQGGFDENYEEMKTYWNNRLEPLTTIVELPNEELIKAYKAGYIYTLLIRDDIIQPDGSVIKELHVGENGYDIMFDHDTIGIVAALLTMGDFTYAKDYLASLPAQLQYDDAKWKYSWPYAVYLDKTGDIDFIEEKFEVIKGHTHRIESDRDFTAGGIMKQTWAIDSLGYWLIDNWSALAGLTTYGYLCDRLYEETQEQKYLTEGEWAADLYEDLLKSVENRQEEMRNTYDYPYLSIDMTVPTEQSARKDPRDGNWASMFLFGRWAWDGYLYGANQENSDMISLIDATYEHGFDRREEYGAAGHYDSAYVGDTIYNFGGYPHGIYSSAYNAGYGSSALRGEAYRESGIRAYEFMIDSAMSGPYGWWEGVAYPDSNSPWDIDHAAGGGGSCQHMWGQSTATKVLFDSLVAEKVGEYVIIGRGIPKEWNTNGEVIEIEDVSVNSGKKFGYRMETANDAITVDFTGEALDIPFSIELIALKDNIASVTVDSHRLTEGIDREMGTILVPAGARNVVIELGEEKAPEEDNNAGLVAFIERMYTVVLGRDAEAEGVEFWVSLLKSGKNDGEDIAKEFFNGNEFNERNLDNTRFVEVLYATFFDRVPDESGMGFYMEMLENGVSRDVVLDGCITSAEFNNICDSYGITAVFSKEDQVRSFVERMYTVALEREADAEGVEFYVKLLLAGGNTDAEDVAKDFINGTEFKNKNLSDTEFLTVLYSTFFDREPDAGGFDYKMSLLQSGVSREAMLDEFITSGEFNDLCNSYGIKAVYTRDELVRNFVERMYTSALGRAAEEEGATFWTNALLSGAATGAQVADNFISGTEFVNRGLSDREYVVTLYATLYNREAPEEDIEFWATAAAHNRRAVLIGFAESQEFATLCEGYGIEAGTLE